MSPIKTLVIVEDDPLIAMDIRERCENAGYLVLAVTGSVAQAEGSGQNLGVFVYDGDLTAEELPWMCGSLSRQHLRTE